MKLLTETQELFNAGKQDWYFCSLGFKHVLIDESKMIMSVHCPKCDWHVKSNDPLFIAELEESHQLRHKQP